MNIETKSVVSSRRRVLLYCSGLLLATAVTGLAQSDKPNFSGTWALDKGQTAGPGNPVEEVIEHNEPIVVITSTQPDGGKFAIRLSTNGKESPNIVNGREMSATTTWDGTSLVTVVRDPQGMQFTEVRSLSEDGKTQTTEGFMGRDRTRAMFKRVTVKKD